MSGSGSHGCSFCNVFYPSNQELFEHELSLMHHTNVEHATGSVHHPCGVCNVDSHSLAAYAKHLREARHKHALIESRKAAESADADGATNRERTNNYWQDDQDCSWDNNYSNRSFDSGGGSWDNNNRRPTPRFRPPAPGRRPRNQGIPHGPRVPNHPSPRNQVPGNWQRDFSNHPRKPEWGRPGPSWRGQPPPLLEPNARFGNSQHFPISQKHNGSSATLPVPVTVSTAHRQKWNTNRGSFDSSTSSQDRLSGNSLPGTPRNRSSSLDAPATEKEVSSDSLQAKLSLKANKIIDDVLKGGTGKKVALEERQKAKESADKGAELLKRAENLCKDLREKRAQAETSREMLEQRKKTQETEGLGKTIEAMSAKSMGRIKGLLASQTWAAPSPSAAATSAKPCKGTMKIAVPVDTRKVLPSSRPLPKPQVDSVPTVRPEAKKKSAMDRKSLFKLVNSPRSRKERQQIGKMLNRYNKVHKHVPRPKLHLQPSLEDRGSDTDPETCPGDMEYNDLPQDVQDQIAQLLQEELDFDIADLFGDKQEDEVLETEPLKDPQEDFTNNLLKEPQKSSTPDMEQQNPFLSGVTQEPTLVVISPETEHPLHQPDIDLETNSYMDAVDNTILEICESVKSSSCTTKAGAPCPREPFEVVDQERTRDLLLTAAQVKQERFSDFVAEGNRTEMLVDAQSSDEQRRQEQHQQQQQQLLQTESSVPWMLTQPQQLKEERLEQAGVVEREEQLKQQQQQQQQQQQHLSQKQKNQLQLPSIEAEHLLQQQQQQQQYLLQQQENQPQPPNNQDEHLVQLHHQPQQQQQQQQRVPQQAEDITDQNISQTTDADTTSECNLSLSLGGKRRLASPTDVNQNLSEAIVTAESPPVQQTAKRAKMDEQESSCGSSLTLKEQSMMDKVLQLSLKEEEIRQKVEQTNAAIQELMSLRQRLLAEEEELRKQRLALLKGAVGTANSTRDNTVSTSLNQSLSSSFVNMMETVDLGPKDNNANVTTEDDIDKATPGTGVTVTSDTGVTATSDTGVIATSDTGVPATSDTGVTGTPDTGVTMQYMGTLEGESDVLKQLAVNLASLKQESYVFMDESALGQEEEEQNRRKLTQSEQEETPTEKTAILSDNVPVPFDNEKVIQWNAKDDFSRSKSIKSVMMDRNTSSAKTKPAAERFTGPVPQKVPQKVLKSRKQRDQNSSLSNSCPLDSSTEGTVVEEPRKRKQKPNTPFAKVVQEYLHAPSSSDVEMEGLERGDSFCIQPKTQKAGRFSPELDGSETLTDGSFAEGFAKQPKVIASPKGKNKKKNNKKNESESETWSEGMGRWTWERHKPQTGSETEGNAHQSKKNKKKGKGKGKGKKGKPQWAPETPDKEKYIIGPHDVAVLSMVMFRTKSLITGGQDGTTRQYRFDTWKPQGLWHAHRAGVTGLWIYHHPAYNNTGCTMLLSGGLDGQLVTANFQGRKELDRKDLRHPITCFHNTSSRIKDKSCHLLYIGQADGTVLCYDMEWMKIKEAWKCSGMAICNMTLVYKERRPTLLCVASHDCSIRIRDVTTGHVLNTIEAHTRAPIFLKGHRNLLYSGGADMTLKVHDLETGNLEALTSLDSKVTSLYVASEVFLAVSLLDGRILLMRIAPKEGQDQGRMKLTVDTVYYGISNIPVTSLCLTRRHLLTGTAAGGVVVIPADSPNCWYCKFGKCGLRFGLQDDLLTHVLSDHVGPHLSHATDIECLWQGCQTHILSSQEPRWTEMHLRRHVRLSGLTP